MIILLYDLWTHLFYHETQGQVRAEHSKSRCQTTGTCWWQRSCQNGTGVVVVCLASECLLCSSAFWPWERERCHALATPSIHLPLFHCRRQILEHSSHIWEPPVILSVHSFFAEKELSQVGSVVSGWRFLGKTLGSFSKQLSGIAQNAPHEFRSSAESGADTVTLNVFSWETISRTWVVLLERRVDTASQHLGEQE